MGTKAHVQLLMPIAMWHDYILSFEMMQQGQCVWAALGHAAAEHLPRCRQAAKTCCIYLNAAYTCRNMVVETVAPLPMAVISLHVTGVRRMSQHPVPRRQGTAAFETVQKVQQTPVARL